MENVTLSFEGFSGSPEDVNEVIGGVTVILLGGKPSGLDSAFAATLIRAKTIADGATDQERLSLVNDLAALHDNFMVDTVGQKLLKATYEVYAFAGECQKNSAGKLCDIDVKITPAGDISIKKMN